LYYFTINPIAISHNKKGIKKERKIRTRFNDESYGWEKIGVNANRTWMEI